MNFDTYGCFKRIIEDTDFMTKATTGEMETFVEIMAHSEDLTKDQYTELYIAITEKYNRMYNPLWKQ